MTKQYKKEARILAKHQILKKHDWEISANNGGTMVLECDLYTSDEKVGLIVPVKSFKETPGKVMEEFIEIIADEYAKIARKRDKNYAYTTTDNGVEINEVEQ